MKHLLLTLFLCLSLTVAGQQQGFNYQAIVRNASGVVLKQTEVKLRISILTNDKTIYQETHDLTTSAAGYVNTVIGNGESTIGTFKDINWSSLNHSIKVELNYGSGFEEIATSALQSVPYAKYAEYTTHSSSEATEKRLTALKKTNDSLVNCVVELKDQLKKNEGTVSELKDATDSFLGFQELQDKDYTTIVPSNGVAQVNITVNLSSVSKDNPIPAKLVYNDGNGNGFKSDIEITYQGSSSMNYPKKNFSIDLDRKIQFGNWVPMDSYHLKANWIDATQSRNVVMGRVVDDVAATLPFEKQRPWRTEWSPSYAGSSKDAMFDNGAKGHIDGFPIEVYINNEYYGLYTWNLKIHRDNYSMSKSNNKHILLKAETHVNFFSFQMGDWEMKNPKIDGVSGAGDIPGDIINTVSKPLNWIATVQNNESAFKQGFDTYFDKTAMIDYYILLEAFFADDDVDKNLSMCTWDGKKWYFLWYDMDTNLGLYWDGSKLLPSSGSVLNSPEPGFSGKTFWRMFFKVYQTDIVARWKELKTSALSYNNVIGRYSEFMSQISQSAYERDFKRWPEIPSHSKCYTSLGQISKWYQERLVWMDSYLK